MYFCSFVKKSFTESFGCATFRQVLRLGVGYDGKSKSMCSADIDVLLPMSKKNYGYKNS